MLVINSIKITKEEGILILLVDYRSLIVPVFTRMSFYPLHFQFQSRIFAVYVKIDLLLSLQNIIVVEQFTRLFK